MSASHWSGFLEFHVAMLLGRRFQAADVMAVGVFDFAEALAVLRAELVAEDGEEPRGQASAKADYFFRPQSPAGPAVAAVSGAARDSVEGTAPGPAPVTRLVRKGSRFSGLPVRMRQTRTATETEESQSGFFCQAKTTSHSTFSDNARPFVSAGIKDWNMLNNSVLNLPSHWE